MGDSSSVSGAHKDSLIEGLVGTRGLAVQREGMRAGADSVTKDEVVSSVSGGPMGEEGPA